MLNAVILGVLFSGTNVQTREGLALNFSQTDVGQVFRMIGEKTGASIVFSSTEKILVTVRLDAATVDEAVQGASSAAGLSFRRTGRVFVVAKPAELKGALAAYFVRQRYDVPAIGSETIAANLTAALPNAEITSSGTSLYIAAIPEDLAQAKDIIAASRASLQKSPMATQVVRLASSAPSKVADSIQNMYPAVKCVVVADLAAKGGTLSLTGPEDDVRGAMAQAEAIDKASSIPAQLETTIVYEIRYAGSLTLRNFLKSAAPMVEVLIAPPHHGPVRPVFRPLTGVAFGGSGGQGGGQGGQGGGQGGQGGQGGMGGGQGGGTMQNLQDTDGPGGNLVGITDDLDDKSKRMILRGAKGDVDAALRLLAAVDVKPYQLRIDVQVLDVSPNDAEQTGFDWSWSPFQFEELPAGTEISNNDGTPTPWESTPTRDIGFGMFSRIPWRVAMGMQGLVTRKQARLLASPNVQVLDNDQASVFIGDTIRTKLTSVGALGGTTTTVAEFPVGIILLIRPRVNADGNITMNVHPIVSTVTALSGELPQTRSREAETTVMVKEGETMVIGGLIRDEEVQVMREVPILSKLPFFGELFKSRSKEKNKSNVLVFITPRIVRDDEPSAVPPEVSRP